MREIILQLRKDIHFIKLLCKIDGYFVWSRWTLAAPRGWWCFQGKHINPGRGALWLADRDTPLRRFNKPHTHTHSLSHSHSHNMEICYLGNVLAGEMNTHCLTLKQGNKKDTSHDLCVQSLSLTWDTHLRWKINNTNGVLFTGRSNGTPDCCKQLKTELENVFLEANKICV